MIGDSANIPSVCAEITRPMAPRPWPSCRICTGVIVIKSTMTNCPDTIATRASVTAGSRTSTPSDETGAVASAVARTRSSIRRGEASMAEHDRTVATIPTRYGPIRPLSCIHSASCRDGASSAGPATAPIVDAHTIQPIIVPRSATG